MELTEKEEQLIKATYDAYYQDFIGADEALADLETIINGDADELLQKTEEI
jgi:hypothetical protein